MKFNLTTIQSSFENLVGWRNDSFDAGIPSFTSPYDSAPSSGQYYNGSHPSVNLENLYYGMLDHVPVEAEFNQWIQNITNETIFEVLRKFEAAKKLNKETSGLLQQGVVFKGAGNIKDLEVNESKFVGWIIELADYQNIGLVMHQLGLQFSKPVTNMPIYLYHSSRQAALTTENFSTTTGLTFEWKTPATLANWRMEFSSTYDAGGYFILGYYQDELTDNQDNAQAVNKLNLWNQNGCTSCGESYNQRRFQSYKSFFRITPMYVENANLNGVLIPDLGDDLTNVNTDFTKTYGLNLDVSIESDITNFLIRHAELFVEPLRKMMAYKLLYYMKDTKRINNQADTAKQQAIIELYRLQSASQIQKDLDDQLKAIDFDLSGLNSPSFPHKKNKISYSSM